MKEYVKVWRDDDGKVQIEFNKTASLREKQDIALRMADIIQETGDRSILTMQLEVSAFLLGLEETGAVQKFYLDNLQRMAAAVRKVAIEQNRRNGQPGILKVKKPEKAS